MKEDQTPKKVFVYDDDPDFGRNFCKMLIREGHSVVFVGDENEALALSSREGLGVDVAFLDLGCLIREDRLDTRISESLRLHNPTIAIAIISGGQNDYSKEMERAGISCFMNKPVLLEVIREFVRRGDVEVPVGQEQFIQRYSVGVVRRELK